MKHNTFLLAFVLLYLSALSQKDKVKTVAICNATLQSYLSSNTQLKFIKFSKDLEQGIEIFPDTSVTGSKNIPYENRYDLGYLGHQYILEKKFGKFPYEELTRLLDSLADKKCEYSWYKGVITVKKLTIKVTSACPTKDEDRIFIKIPIYAEYPGGERALTKHIKNKLAENPDLKFPEADTVLLLKMTVRKSGIVDEVKFIDSSSVTINSVIKSALMNAEKWKPAMQGGNWVHSYVEVFIRFRKDGSIETDYLY